MKKHLLTLIASGALVALAGSAMAQSAPAATGTDNAAASQGTDPLLLPDGSLAPDSQAAAQPKLKFKIKGVNADDDEGGDDGEGQGEGHGEGVDDNG